MNAQQGRRPRSGVSMVAMGEGFPRKKGGLPRLEDPRERILRHKTTEGSVVCHLFVDRAGGSGGERCSPQVLKQSGNVDIFNRETKFRCVLVIVAG